MSTGKAFCRTSVCMIGIAAASLAAEAATESRTGGDGVDLPRVDGAAATRRQGSAESTAAGKMTLRPWKRL